VQNLFLQQGIYISLLSMANKLKIIQKEAAEPSILPQEKEEKQQSKNC
jgi:hypothetical protein